MGIYVLIHGGGHGGWCWDRLTPLLEEAGHLVFAPTLSGVGERLKEATPETSLETHIAEVAELIAGEDLANVILAGHSYGGMVITGVADRIPSCISRLVYLDAAIPENDEALVDTSPGLRTVAEQDVRLVNDVEMALWPETIPPVVYGLVRPEDLAFAGARLTAHPWRTMTQPLRLRDPLAVSSIPRAIVNCTSTLAKRPEETRARWTAGDHVWEIDTGHDLMITEPEQLAKILLALA